MPRMTAGKRSELESFWRAHLDGWRRSDLNQREYCELHGLPLKRFGNWRAKLKHEESASASKLLYRHGGALRPYVLSCERRLVLDVRTRVARIGRAEPHTRRTSHGAY